MESLLSKTHEVPPGSLLYMWLRSKEKSSQVSGDCRLHGGLVDATPLWHYLLTPPVARACKCEQLCLAATS